MKLTGGVFFREGDGIDAKKLIAKVCDGGRITTDDARVATGTEQVGFAVHPPRRGFWAIVDSADGALGLGGGDWSKVALAANHLRTDAIWYRTYELDLALALYFPSGGTWMRAYVGIADELINRLDADGVPVHESQPPATATEALLASVAYEPGVYASGPDATVARAMLGLHEALIAGDAAALKARFAELPEPQRALGLAIVRGADRGEWKACLQTAALQILAEPARMRVSLKQPTLDEEILRRAGGLAETEAELAPLVDRLDAIELDAETRSSHSHPAGVAMLAYDLGKRGAPSLVLACELRLLRRGEPAWYTCNNVLGTLLKRTPFTLDATAREVLQIVEGRLPELGQSAIDSITYNLACIYARAGDPVRALVELRRCETPLKQNTHPERDTDLETLWTDPAFLALITPRANPVEELVIAPAYVVPPEHAVPRLAIDLEERPDAEAALIDRLGGKPNVPAGEFTWPVGYARPMSLIVQLVGKAGGGTIELGDIHVLQVFADLEGDYYEDHKVIAHREPCVVVAEPPVTVELNETKAITLRPGFDDVRILDFELEVDDARTHAWCDKVGGIAVGANLDDDPRDSQGQPMRLVLELVSTDDWFLWALFANEQHTELRLDVVRG